MNILQHKATNHYIVKHNKLYTQHNTSSDVNKSINKLSPKRWVDNHILVFSLFGPLCICIKFNVASNDKTRPSVCTSLQDVIGSKSPASDIECQLSADAFWCLQLQRLTLPIISYRENRFLRVCSSWVVWTTYVNIVRFFILCMPLRGPSAAEGVVFSDVRPSVRAWSYTESSLARRPFNRSWGISPNLHTFDAVGDRDELVIFWGRKVKGQGRGTSGVGIPIEGSPTTI